MPSVGDVARASVIASHREQLVTPPRLYVPAAQLVQTLAAVAALAYLPAAQGAQAADALLLANLPGSQAEQFMVWLRW